MERVDGNLMPNEQVLYKTRKHWVCVMKSLIVTLAISLPFILPFVFNVPVDKIAGLTVAFTLASIIGLVFMLVYACIFTKVLVTNKRIIGVIDMFVKKFHFEILLSQITSTEIKQNFLGKLFNYGSVTVYTSNGKDSFTVIKPFEFQNRIENRG